MRKFVLVVASSFSLKGGTASPDWHSKASGIKKLKPGVSLRQFVDEYMLSVLGDKKFELVERDETNIYCSHSSDDGELTMSWQFCQYIDTEIMTAVSQITPEELIRDLPNILPLNKL